MNKNLRIFSLTVVFGFVAFVGAQARQNLPATAADREKAVENNLTGVIRIEGEAPWTIRERMAHYGLKGVSVAVIHHYQLDWAKGYGWADDSAKIPVTVQTLFQAASISKSLNAIGVLKLAQEHRLM